MPHSRSLLRVASHLGPGVDSAEDLVQETLLRAWRGYDRFEPDTNVRAWLFRILFNVFYSGWRRSRKHPVFVPLEHGASVPFGRSRVAANDAVAVVEAVESLSEEHRTVVLLGIVEGFTCRELAGILSIPIGTVMSRLSRARQALRERLAPQRAETSHSQASHLLAEREVSELR